MPGQEMDALPAFSALSSLPAVEGFLVPGLFDVEGGQAGGAGVLGPQLSLPTGQELTQGHWHPWAEVFCKAGHTAQLWALREQL